MARATCEDCPWTATGALLAVSDQAEDHERSEMHDVTIKRTATDGGLPTTPGCWVLEPTHDGEWHASVEFDGYDHTTGCGETLRAPDDIAEVAMAQPDVADTIEYCTDCLDHVDADHDPRLLADGGRRRLPYADLEWEDCQVTETAADRLEEKAEKYGPQAYQDTDPLDHVQRAEEKLADIRAAVESMELEAGRIAAADAYNHVLMALTNIPEEHPPRADGGQPTGAGGGSAAQPEPEPAGAIDNSFDDAEQQPLHVGDHVSDREGDDEPMLVSGLPGETADEWGVDTFDATVAELNEDYPGTDDVVQVCYPQRTDTSLGLDMGESQTEYSFPRSRLRLEEPIHDVGGGDGD